MINIPSLTQANWFTIILAKLFGCRKVVKDIDDNFCCIITMYYWRGIVYVTELYTEETH